MLNKDDQRYKGLTSDKVLATNTIWTVSMKVFPLIIGLVTIPYLIRSLGEEGFGILSIIWLVISYFSMFDLGISRALTKNVSESIGKKEYSNISSIAWTGVLFITVMGLVAGFIMHEFGQLIFEGFFNIKEVDISQIVIYLSIAIPFIVSTSGFKAILMAEQKFKVVSTIQSLNSLLNYLLPFLLIYLFSISFSAIVMALMILKIVIFVLFMLSALISEPTLRSEFKVEAIAFKAMFRFGKWATISNIVGPLMGHLDRYAIATFISLTAVTYYTTPLEVLGKVMILPMSFILVLFPAFSTLSGKTYENRERLFFNGIQGLMVLLFPVFLISSTFSSVGLGLWLGEEFAEESTFIAQIFCAVFFLRGMAFIPSTFLHGMDRPDLTAKFHLLEVIVFSSALYIVSQFTNDINYIAVVSLGITILDTSLLYIACYKLIAQKEDYLKNIVYQIALFGLILISMSFLNFTPFTIILTVVIVGVFLAVYFDYLKRIVAKIRAQF
ncbi:MAG: oligosaccharide flippase family protein [Balneolaceae bacterium]|nr:oligosaccharide flippase family protein [Balneolaceae bacterium]MBO6545293.1 oligosaccharide flippase family protein [Balneolaceae bacterium]MBO6646689.1 oligosaccharide flippase family protein [Balneolaceae bacterium]